MTDPKTIDVVAPAGPAEKTASPAHPVVAPVTQPDKGASEASPAKQS